MKSKKSIRKHVGIKKGDVFKCTSTIQFSRDEHIHKKEANRIQIDNGVFEVVQKIKNSEYCVTQFLFEGAGISIKCRIAKEFIKSNCKKIPRLKAELLYKTLRSSV